MNHILVGAKFKSNDIEYIFKCFDEIKIGDLVVVDTKLGFNVATITSIEPDHNKIPLGELREVVQVVDISNFTERQEREKRAKYLKRKMDAKVRQLQAITVYEMLAEKDPELKEMLSELKTLV